MIFDIVADITLFEHVAEPKVSGVKSGYAPHHKFPHIDWLASGFHYYLDEEWHFPGETIEAGIRLVSWELFATPCGQEWSSRYANCTKWSA